ncbi:MULTISPECIES: TetR/AcrR family transcriptional regulator C-terminal domain-containing protein [unclassified Nocardia]|uniref:TetR/AcrR family transcriptional regulator C-terminal domain-containing protein n=1 Tax=unclassified Nocardia TaxID=2637762 RepID=UPI00278C5027|nr:MULTISPECIES: TetR/AcrR family transcriptional regulator C-terminal domain-containing protein [unclassified Nocardia]
MTAKAEQFATVWMRPQRTRRDTPALNREQIVAEAIALLDSEGLEALSMRRLGTRLNAGATSLYTHVANKEELLELVVDEVFGEIRLPERPAAESWRTDLMEFGRSMRATMLRHVWMPAVLSTAGLVYLGPNVMRMTDGMLGILEVAGFDATTSDRATNAIFAYLIGATTTETAMITTVTRSGLGEQEWMEQIMIASQRMSEPYPRLHRSYARHRELDSARSRDEFFDTELELLIDGLEARRAR